MFTRKPNPTPMAPSAPVKPSALGAMLAEAELVKVEAEWQARLAVVRDALVLPAAHRIVRRALPAKHQEMRIFNDQPMEAWFVEYPYIQDNEPRSAYYGLSELGSDFWLERFRESEPKAYVLWARTTELPFSTRKAAEQWLRNRLNEGSEDVYYDDKGQVIAAPEQDQ